MSIVNLDDYSIAKPTEAEVAAIKRLAASKDFEVFCAFLARRLQTGGFDLLRFPRERQEFDLVQAQGAYLFFRSMMDTVESSAEMNTDDTSRKDRGGANIGGLKVRT